MKKRIVGVALAATAALALSGCGTTAGAGGADNASGAIKIGVSFDQMDDAFRVGEKKYLDQYAKEMGVELVYQNAQRDAQTQSSQIQSFISQGVQGIIEIPWDTEAVAADVAAAKSAGIPLALMDQQPANTDDVFYYVGSDPTSDGRMIGEHLIELAGGKPLEVLELQGSLNSVNGIQRSEGFEEAIASAPNITVVAKAPTDWDAAKALSATQNALQAHPNIGAIYAPWTGALPSVYSALDQADRLHKVGEEGHVITVSINGDQLGCKYVGDGSNDLDVATPANGMAKQALTAVLDGIKDDEPKQNVELLEGTPYTPDTIDSLRDDIWGCDV